MRCEKNNIITNCLPEQNPYYHYAMHNKRKSLRNYYGSNDMVIIGLNDADGVRCSLTNKKCILDYLKNMLLSRNNIIYSINAFSKMSCNINPTEYFLNNNLSIEEIRNFQIEEIVSELIKSYGIIGKLGYLTTYFYNFEQKNDKNKLCDIIREYQEPIIIYSSGINDLTNTIKNNGIQDVVNNAIKKLEHNIEQILSLNNKADIIVLQGNSDLQKKPSIFDDDIINEYAYYIQDLCQKFHQNYIDSSVFFQNYDYTKAQILLTEQIINELYYKKIWSQDNVSFNVQERILKKIQR